MSVKTIVSKMKALLNSDVDNMRWHISGDVYRKLLDGGYIIRMNEGHCNVYTCFGLPITVHMELENHVSIE